MKRTDPLIDLPTMEQDSAYDSPRSADLSLSPLSPHSSIGKCTSLCSIACSSCKKTFVDPRVLPCLHTFCFRCLEANSCKSKKKIICPECHVDFCLPSNGIEGLIPDYGIVSFIKSLKGHLFCSSCKIADVVTAVAKCINCDNFLCQSCVNAHNYMYCFEGHKVIEFPKDFLADKEDKMSTDPLEDGQVNCLVHLTTQITHFCVLCNEPVCTLCFVDPHSGHRFEPLDSISDALISFMGAAMDENKSRVSELNISLRSTKRMDNFLRNQYLDISQKITENYNLFNAILLKHKQQQMSVLEQLYFKSKAAVQNHVNVYQDTLEKTTKVADFYTRLTKFGSTTQILMFKKMLEDKRFPIFKPKPISCNLKFVSKPCDFASMIFSAFGHVASEVNAAPERDYSQSLINNAFCKYDKWSSHGLSAHGDLKFSELGIGDDLLNPIPRSFSLKSSVTRQVITYSHKFGRYGSSQGEFTEPNGVAINAAGDIIIADTNNNRVQIFDKTGVYKYHFGEGSKAKDSINLLFPNRVAVMEKTGDIVVTERAPTHQIQIYNQYGQYIRRFGSNILQHPRAVAVDAQGRIIVVECKVMRVIIFDQSGEILNKFNCSQTLHFPNGVAVNDRQQIFISDNRIHCVVVYDYNGNLIRTIGQEGLTNYPIGVMLNNKGQVIVADNHNNFNLTVFTQEGQFVAAVESKVKHAQCFDADISNEGSVVLTSKDYKVYIYQTAF